MAFWGNSFIFNDIPCEDFDLMLYDLDNNSQSAGSFASGVSVIEETLSKRYKPLFYGVKFDKKLEFTIVFGVNQKRIDIGKYLDRYELEAVAFWLTGHDKYMWLEVEQEDLEYVRYRCMVTNLEIVEYGNIPWALKATITCDSPYAYLYPQVFEYEITGSKNIHFFNESSHNGYFMPKIEFIRQDNISGDTYNQFIIKNTSDNNRIFKFWGLPSSVSRITVDNENCIITNDQGVNIYPYFNLNFLRLVKGENILQVHGYGTLRIICEFPVNVGG